MSPLYGWAGPGKMQEMDLPRATVPQITEPTSPEAAGPTTKERFFRCTVDGCGRKFRKAMIHARHFNQSHEALRTDAETWRQYMEEVWE